MSIELVFRPKRCKFPCEWDTDEDIDVGASNQFRFLLIQGYQEDGRFALNTSIG